MSTMVVEVCTIDDVQLHPNADALVLATIKGWQTAIKKDPETGKTQFNEGDLCVFFPPDAILTPEWAEKLGVINYLSPVKNDNKLVTGYRVRACRLRGEVSYGFVTTSPEGVKLGDDLAEFYQVQKWEPPVKFKVGNSAPPVPGFEEYTDIEHFGNYHRAFEEGEDVVLSEKIHGTNARYCMVYQEVDGERKPEFFVGSHHMVKRPPKDGQDTWSSVYWGALTQSMKDLLNHLIHEAKFAVVLFGEIAGRGVQKNFSYGQDKPTFFAFDIQMDGKWLNEDEKDKLFQQFNISRVPVLYRGPYSKEVVKEHTNGPSMVPGAQHIREGCVITPLEEMVSRVLRGKRLILKSVSADYLAKS